MTFYPSKSPVYVSFTARDCLCCLSCVWDCAVKRPRATVAALISSPKALGMKCHIRRVSTRVTFTALIIYMTPLTPGAKGQHISVDGLAVIWRVFLFIKCFIVVSVPDLFMTEIYSHSPQTITFVFMLFSAFLGKMDCFWGRERRHKYSRFIHYRFGSLPLSQPICLFILRVSRYNNFLPEWPQSLICI